jgi:hypothetical protein
MQALLQASALLVICGLWLVNRATNSIFLEVERFFLRAIETFAP